MENNITVQDFADDVRSRLNDTSGTFTDNQIKSYLNTALRRVGRSDGIDKLYQHHDTFELSTVNADGTPSAKWDLGKIGTIIDIEKLRILKTSESGVKMVSPSYVDDNDFYDRVTLPEQNMPGDPEIYTVNQIGTNNKLVFNRPPKDAMAIDIKYSAFHPRITEMTDLIQINWNYLDIFVDIVLIIHKIETTDQSTARALWEDVDLMIVELKELLAKRKKALPFRRIQRSF